MPANPNPDPTVLPHVCTFCGSADVEIERDGAVDLGVFVRCTACGHQRHQQVLGFFERRAFLFVAHTYAERRNLAVKRTVFGHEAFGKMCLYFTMWQTGDDVYRLMNDAPDAPHYGIICGLLRSEYAAAAVREKLGLQVIEPVGGKKL